MRFTRPFRPPTPLRDAKRARLYSVSTRAADKAQCRSTSQVPVLADDPQSRRMRGQQFERTGVDTLDALHRASKASCVRCRQSSKFDSVVSKLPQSPLSASSSSERARSASALAPMFRALPFML